MFLTEFKALVIGFVRDNEAVTDEQNLAQAIEAAIHRVSIDKPRYASEDITPSGNTLALPSDWTDGVSTVLCIEHPIGNAPPTYLPHDRWQMYLSPTGLQIMLYDAGTDDYRVTYTILHEITVSANSMAPYLNELVAAYAAGVLLKQLAVHYTTQGESTISADTVDHSIRGQNYEDRADMLFQRYYDGLGIEAKRADPESVNVDWNLRSVWSRNIHNRWWTF